MDSGHPIDDAPPPPYSETDIYSVSHGESGRSPVIPVGNTDQRLSPQQTQADDTAHSVRSATTASGEVIYTPPLTPQSNHQSNFPNFASETSDPLSTSSAAAYFETRPAPPLPVDQHLVIQSIRIRRDSMPEDIPYPDENFAGHDVHMQDWQTFLNHLIPHHSALSNSQVIDRKLRAERIEQSSNGNINNSDKACSPVEAQLDQIRTPVDVGGEQDHYRRVEETVREWNDGFFGPRNVVIQMTASTGDELPMPGAWDRAFDQTEAAGSSAQRQGPRDRWGSRFGRFNPFGGGGGGRGFNFGGITVDGDRVAIGEHFVADRNGVRIGGFTADSRGVRMDGRPLAAGPPGFQQQQQRGFFPIPDYGPFGAPVGVLPGGPFEHRRALSNNEDETRGNGRRGGRGHGRHGGHGLGRHRNEDDKRRWHRSSSASSSSSSSSASSASSVGSLPNYDDLRDTQLPIARTRLQEWLADRDQVVTKKDVKTLREQIKAAKLGTSSSSSQPGSGSGSGIPTGVAADEVALRKEVKGLLADWKALKRQQRQLRRQQKGDRRERRRAEKRERRNTKREMKRALRDRHRGGSGGSGFPFGGMAPPPPPPPPTYDHDHGHARDAKGLSPPGLGIPGVPGVPATPGLRGWGGFPGFPPQAHAHPHGHGHGPCSPWGRGGAGGPFGRGCGRRPFGGPSGFPGPVGRGRAAPPGAWPRTCGLDDEDGHVAQETGHVHRREAREIYAEAESLEAQIAARETELAKLKDRMAEQRAGADGKVKEPGEPDAGDSNGTTEQPTGGTADSEEQVRHAEAEIADLTGHIRQLRLEGDEAYARELAQEDMKYGSA